MQTPHHVHYAVTCKALHGLALPLLPSTTLHLSGFAAEPQPTPPTHGPQETQYTLAE